jgi:hypothetical protein
VNEYRAVVVRCWDVTTTPTTALSFQKQRARVSPLVLMAYAIAAIASVVAAFEIVFNGLCMGEDFQCAPMRDNAIHSAEVAGLLILIALIVRVVEGKRS